MPEVFVERVVEPDCASVSKLVSSSEDERIYETDESGLGLVVRRTNQLASLASVSMRLSDYILMGLIAEYDHFIANLARLVIEKKPHILNESDRRVSYSDLVGMTSIAEMREDLLDSEIGHLLRKSHEDQLKWFSEKLQMKLEPSRDLLGKFAELCERRNLIAHAGGLVSHRYLQICSKYSISANNLTAGDRFLNNGKYFLQASETVIELAAQLVHVVWQKLEGGKSQTAARALINITYALIRDRKFKLAIRLIEFLLQNNSTHMDGETRRIHIINLSNAMKLDGNENYLTVLDREDWTVGSLAMQACICSIREEEEKFLLAFKKAYAAEEISTVEFQAWPVFECMRQKPLVLAQVAAIVGSSAGDIKDLSHISSIMDSLLSVRKKSAKPKEQV